MPILLLALYVLIGAAAAGLAVASDQVTAGPAAGTTLALDVALVAVALLAPPVWRRVAWTLLLAVEAVAVVALVATVPSGPVAGKALLALSLLRLGLLLSSPVRAHLRSSPPRPAAT